MGAAALAARHLGQHAVRSRWKRGPLPWAEIAGKCPLHGGRLSSREEARHLLIRRGVIAVLDLAAESTRVPPIRRTHGGLPAAFGPRLHAPPPPAVLEEAVAFVHPNMPPTDSHLCALRTGPLPQRRHRRGLASHTDAAATADDVIARLQSPPGSTPCEAPSARRLLIHEASRGPMLRRGGNSIGKATCYTVVR